MKKLLPLLILITLIIGCTQPTPDHLIEIRKSGNFYNGSKIEDINSLLTQLKSTGISSLTIAGEPDANTEELILVTELARQLQIAEVKLSTIDTK